jgi:hypothetical protein
MNHKDLTAILNVVLGSMTSATAGVVVLKINITNFRKEQKMKSALISLLICVGLLLQGCAGYQVRPLVNGKPVPVPQEHKNDLLWVVSITAVIVVGILIYENNHGDSNKTYNTTNITENPNSIENEHNQHIPNGKAYGWHRNND